MAGDGFLGIDHVPFNYRVRDARLERGWTRRELAERAGTSPTQVGEYEALKKWPTPVVAARIADALGDAPEWLFPPEVAAALGGRPAETVTTVLPADCLSIHSGEMRALPAPADDFEQVDLTNAVGTALATLTPRERHIVTEINSGATYQEVGKEFNVTRERIRQIHSRAFGKLRHPKHHLRDFVGSEAT